nr:hypothetical protein [Tanacetum cinerariifolium]
MHNYHLERGPPRYAFKVDIQKAYDTVEWGFLKEVLIGFGFHDSMIGWIMECVTTTSFSISINGSLHGFLRVHDSMVFKYHRYCADLELINLCFVDDLFLFVHGDVDSDILIRDALEEFKNVLGLTLSHPKSTAYFCNVLNHTKLSIHNVLPFEEGRLPVKYLGKVKVTWEVICLPMDEGGLGVLKLCHLIWDFIRFSIGDGATTSVWLDRWNEGDPLANAISTRDIFNQVLISLLNYHSLGVVKPFSVAQVWSLLRPRNPKVPIMHQEQAQQATNDEKLVPSDDRVKIGSSNLRLDPTLTQKEKTYQVILDIIKNSSCYKAFLITADVPKIYMQQFWFTITKGRRPVKTDFDRQELKFCGVRTREIMPYPRLKFISKGEEHQVYEKPIPDILVTDDIQNSEAYKTFITLSIGLIPPKKGRGNRAHGTKATVIPKKATADPKKKLPKKKESKKKVSHKQSSITADGNILQDPDEALKLGKSVSQTEAKTAKMNHKVNQHIGQLAEGNPEELPSETLHKAIKASKRERRFQHQSGGSSEGAGITPEVLDESIRKSTVSYEGAGISPKVLDEAKDKSKAQADEDEWGSTDDEALLFDEKDKQVKEITWVSTDNDKEDDESINIENIDDERTESDNNDHEMIDAVKTDVEKEHEENAKKVKEQKANEEQKADKEQKGDDQAEDRQVWVPISVTNKENPNLLQSTSSHSISSNYEVPTIQQEPLHEVNVSVIPNPIQIPPSTPPAPPLPAKKIRATPAQANQVLESEVLTAIVQRVHSAVDKYLGSSLGDTLKKVLQRHTEELIQQNPQKDVSEIKKVKQEHASKEKMPKHLTTQFDQAADDEHSLLVDKNDMDRLVVDPLSKKKRRHEDKDQHPPARSDQGMKKRRIRKDDEPSMKTSKSKESAKGKILSSTCNIGKYVSIDNSVHEHEHVVPMDIKEPNLDNVANDADKSQVDAIPNIPKQDWFKQLPTPETPDPDWKTVKLLMMV